MQVFGNAFLALFSLVIGKARCQSQCMMCPDGTKDLQNPDRVVPFFNLDDGNANPTCQQVADAAYDADPRNINCTLVQAQAGYCGCAGVVPERKCSFCPSGAQPAHMDLVSPSSDVCGDLFKYIEFLDQDGCKSPRFKSMQGLGFICGCPGVGPQCSMCSDGSMPPYLDKQALPSGETCQDMVKTIEGYTADTCFDAETIIYVAAARCGCKGAQFPVCSYQQNTHLCTHALLDTALDQHCECYSFCDGKFSTCHDFPGGLLSPQMCSGTAVSGCNRAVAIDEATSSADSMHSRFPPLVLAGLGATVFQMARGLL